MKKKHTVVRSGSQAAKKIKLSVQETTSSEADVSAEDVAVTNLDQKPAAKREYKTFGIF